MDSHKKTAIIVGALFIIATVTAILSGVTLGSTLDAPDYLVNVPANESQVVMAAIFELILAISVIGIGFILYPILKKHIENLALGYFCFRLTEAILIIVASVGLLSLLTLSQEYAAGTLDSSYYLPLGSSLLALRDWSFVIGTMIFLGLGGLLLNYILYQSRLVPRWLAAWGLLGATCITIYGLLELFGLGSEYPVIAILAAPIAIQEMVFAVWLMVKGFNPAAIAPRKQDEVITVE